MRVLSRRSTSTMRCAEVRKPSLTWGSTPCSVLGYKIFLGCAVTLVIVMLCLWVARQVERMRAQKMLAKWLKQPDSFTARDRLANIVVSLRQRRTFSEDLTEHRRSPSLHDHTAVDNEKSNSSNSSNTPRAAYDYYSTQATTTDATSSPTDATTAESTTTTSPTLLCEERCIICFGSPNSLAVELLPCGHYQMCAPCVLQLWRSGGPHKPIRCPLCRQLVHFICPAYDVREQCSSHRTHATRATAGRERRSLNTLASPVSSSLTHSFASSSASWSFATARSEDTTQPNEEAISNTPIDDLVQTPHENSSSLRSLLHRIRDILHAWLTMWPRRPSHIPRQTSHSRANRHHHRYGHRRNRSPSLPASINTELTAAQIENVERMLFHNYNRRFWRLQYGDAVSSNVLPWHERWVRRLRFITDAHYLPAIVAIRISLLHVSMLAYLMLPQDYMPYSFYGCGGYGRAGTSSTNSNNSGGLFSSAASTLLLAGSAVQQKSYSLGMAAVSFIASFLRPCATTRVWGLPSARMLSMSLMRLGGMADTALTVVLYYSVGAVELLMRSTDDIFMIVFGVILIGDLLHRLLFDSAHATGPE